MVHLIKTDDTVKEQCHPLAIASIVIHTDFIPCVDHTKGITTIPKNGMLGVTELSYYFWYDIHTSFFTVWVPTKPHLILWRGGGEKLVAGGEDMVGVCLTRSAPSPT